MRDAILTINAGSSSLKLAAFENDAGALRLAISGSVEDIESTPHFMAHAADGRILADRRETLAAGALSLPDMAVDWMERHVGDRQIVAVGHRVVHGGRDHTCPERVTPDLLVALERLIPLAPLHQRHNIAPMRALAATRPDLPQVACFDTAFHATMPVVATRFAPMKRKASAATASTGSPTNMSPSACARWRPRLPMDESSSPISAMAQAFAPCSRAAASIPRWAFPPSTGW